MKIEQKKWDRGWKDISSNGVDAQLVLAFGAASLLRDKKYFDEIKAFYPSAHIVMCSTAGEILGTEVSDGTISVTAVRFEKAGMKFASARIGNAEESFDVGRKLASSIKKEGLVHAMVFSDGLKVNGTSLVNGILEVLPDVSVTGGLVGDGADFKHTFVGLDRAPEEGNAVFIGFYGSLKVGYGSLGGWDTFGVERKITKSKGNVLYELDGKPALKLYKDYLGKQAAGLPGTGLLFPLSLKLKAKNGEAEVVRTILGVDEKGQSLTFAGDMPEGTIATLMKANFDRLIDGAGGAASMSIKSGKAQLAVLISCIGRKLVLKERVEEEIEAVRNVLGEKAAITGFYSYGEICPTAPSEKQCQLHNQTMTITVLSEDA
ncbi:FIST C-terminal domain-containing protein [Candidatus Woesearchaeota archaeon]|nr:FIST C-terminal domain-containing protein [Candidatus Woesearchaeota archaeon]